MSEAAAAGAPTGGESTQAGAQTAQGQSQSQQGQDGALKGSAQPVANQPTKAELRDLADDNMDAMVTVKVDGQTKKMSVREALKQAELGGAAQRRMQEAAQTKKEMQKLLEDEAEYFKRKGIDPDRFAEERLVKKYEKMAMTPEQRKAMEEREELQGYKTRETQTRDHAISQIKNYVGDLPPEYVEALSKATPEQIQGEIKRAEGVYRQQQASLEKEFLDAWSESGLPKDTVFGTWVASLMHASQVQKSAGQREQALQAKEAATIVKENFMSAVSRITGQMDPESVHRLLGPETMKRLREFDVQRVTAKSAPQFERQDSPARKPASSKNTKQVDESGWKKAWSQFG
jgi:hypothetical protein